MVTNSFITILKKSLSLPIIIIAEYNYIQYLPKVWERARKPYGKRYFSVFPKNTIFVGTRRIFLVVVIVCRKKLILFQIFAIKGRVTFKSSPKFGNTP
jgi:hypothetical protein